MLFRPEKSADADVAVNKRKYNSGEVKQQFECCVYKQQRKILLTTFKNNT